MSDFSFDVFPAGLLGGDGRRIRPGSLVRLQFENAHVMGEVTGWAGSRGVEVSLEDDPFLLTVQPHELFRVDAMLDDPVTTGTVIIDTDPRATVLVLPVGGRDVQVRVGVDEATAPVASLLDGAPSAAPGSGRDLRGWAARCAETLAPLTEQERADVVFETFDMPMLRRVLDEAVLPAELQAVVPVVTDQTEPQRSDSANVPALIDAWLRGRGHIGRADASARPIIALGPTIAVRTLPFQLDAVVHQVAAGLRAVSDAERAAVVVAGGTPAMMYGTLLAASARFGAANTVSIQVPQDWQVGGRSVVQPLVEMSLTDGVLGSFSS